MGKEVLTLGDIEIYLILISLKDVDIEKVLVSNKISFGEKNHKYFIGHLYNNHKVNSLHITLLKTSAYVKSYHEDDDFLEKYNTIRDKVSAGIKKEFDSKPVYDKMFLKTKIKSCGNEVYRFLQ